MGEIEEYRLELLESSQGYSLLTFAVSVFGHDDGFPALLGVSTRSRFAGEVNLEPYKIRNPGTVICLVEHPEQLGDVDPDNGLYHKGEITFALWRDERYQTELARISWSVWTYANLGSFNPNHRVDPCTASYIEHDFETMRQRHAGKPYWIAHRVKEN